MEQLELLNRIKRMRRQRPLTNCYSLGALERVEHIWEKDDSFLFSYEDHGIKRLMYFVKDMESLDFLISQIKEGKYYLEIMTQEPEKNFPKGTFLVTKMLRLANADCQSVFQNAAVLRYSDETVGEIAAEKDVKEINTLLWSVFHTEVSHLLTDEELAEVVQKGQISIHRGEHGIDAVLQAEVMPKRFYINQVINQTDKAIIHAMLLNRLCKYVEGGGKYLYAWVEEQNIASRKFHAKYGMVHDGMWNLVYCAEK